MSMRVLQLCWGFPPEAYDDGSGSVGELCKGLVAGRWLGWLGTAGRGSAVPLLMPGHEKIEGVWATRVPGDRAGEPVVAVAEAFRPEIIDFHEYRDLALVRHAAGRTGARVVLTIHELICLRAGPTQLFENLGSASARARRSSSRVGQQWEEFGEVSSQSYYVGASSSEASAASRRRQ